jgi:hypothetical protein
MPAFGFSAANNSNELQKLNNLEIIKPKLNLGIDSKKEDDHLEDMKSLIIDQSKNSKLNDKNSSNNPFR